MSRADLNIGDDLLIYPGLNVTIEGKTFEVIKGQCVIRLIHVEAPKFAAPEPSTPVGS